MSLILQYKRPEYLYGATARQWRHWYGPYFRFSVNRRQQSVLLRLERGLARTAEVRYASPVFWRRGDLESAQLAASLLNRSGFINPVALAHHRVWTYQQPGTVGRANPQRRPVRFQSADDLFSGFQDIPQTGSRELVPHDAISEHLRELGKVARRREPGLRRLVKEWQSDVIAADIDLSSDELDLTGHIATVVTLTSDIGASWHLIGGPRSSIYSDWYSDTN